MLENNEIIAVLDIETTGLSPWNASIVEIGICSLNLKNGEIGFLFNKIIKEKEILHEKFQARRLEDSWVFLNTDLSLDDVLRAPDIETIRHEVQNILNEYPLTAYNRQFDFGFLRNRGFEIPFPLPCPMKAATPVLKIRRRRGGYKWPSFQEAWRYFFPEESDYIEKHRAYDDVIHEAKLVYVLYRMGAWKPIVC